MKKSKRRHRFLPLAIGTSGGVVLASLAFWFFKEQADHVVEGTADPYDTAIMKAVHTIDNPTTHRLMHAITQLGSHTAITACAVSSPLKMVAASPAASPRPLSKGTSTITCRATSTWRAITSW